MRAKNDLKLKYWSGWYNTGPGCDNTGPGCDNSGPRMLKYWSPDVKILVLGCENTGPWMC